MATMASQRATSIRKLWSDFSVTEADLNQPTTEFVMSFFERVLEDMALLEFAFQDHASDQVLNFASVADGSRKTVVCNILRHIFAKIKGIQFGLEDIIEPVPQRFGKLVDVLIHLVQYLDYYFGNEFNKVMEDVDRQSLLKDECIREIDELTDGRNQIALENKRVNIELKSKLEEKSKYTALLSKFKGKTLEVTAEHNKLKAIHDKLEAELTAVEEAIQKGNEEIEEIKGNIILSPDAVSRERVQLMDKRKELEERHAAIKSTSEEKNHLAVQLEELCSAMETTPSLIKDLAHKHAFLKDLGKGFHEDERTYRKAMEKVEAVEKEYESTKLELSNCYQETVKLKEEHAARCDSLENELTKANQCMQEAEDEHIKKGAEQVQVAQEIHIYKEMIASLDEPMKVLEEQFLEQKLQIENEVAQFHQKVADKIGVMERKLGMPSFGRQ